MDPNRIFGIEYHLDGTDWIIPIYAENHLDAIRRLEAIRRSGRMYGQVIRQIIEGDKITEASIDDPRRN